jgi:hypothetical protein
MKKTNITNLIKEIISQDMDKLRADHLGTLRGTLMNIQGLIAREGSPETTLASIDKAVKDALDKVKSSDPVTKVSESALSPGYLTNIYSDNERLEATIYKDGRASITMRDPKGNMMISTAAVPLQTLEDSIAKLETGMNSVQISNFIEKVMSNPKVQSLQSV